jgi:hypothetical protein
MEPDKNGNRVRSGRRSLKQMTPEQEQNIAEHLDRLAPFVRCQKCGWEGPVKSAVLECPDCG